jgi:hypothetical protein
MSNQDRIIYNLKLMIKEDIRCLDYAIKDLATRRQQIINSCPHFLHVPAGRDIVYCEVCDRRFGWSCPNSDTGYCRYIDEHTENCVYCGQPEERL